MARRVNFNYEKRQQEIRKQKKKLEKAEAKRARKEAIAAGEIVPEPEVEELAPSDDPWANAEALARGERLERPDDSD